MDMSLPRCHSAYAILRKLQANPAAADELMQEYLTELFLPQGIAINYVSVSLGSATSLNSVNGKCRTVDGTELFFKFHTEENESRVSQNNRMYQGESLIATGWNMIEPYASSPVAGAQCELYPWISEKTVYSLLSDFEMQVLQDGSNSPDSKSLLRGLSIIQSSIKKTTANMLPTLLPSDDTLSEAAIHQLFASRLDSEGSQSSRLASWYGANTRIVVGDREISFHELSHTQWRINDTDIPWTISTILKDAAMLLNRQHANGMASVVAHGDEHFANQFLIDDTIYFFDPAFAGRMPALLAMVKATTHNTIAHPFWLYEPSQLNERFKGTASYTAGQMSVNHNWSFSQVSPLRLKILDLYIDHFWRPMIAALQGGDCLPPWWRQYVRAAVFCSPFLAKNLCSSNNFSAERVVYNLGILMESVQFLDQRLAQIG